MRTRWMGAAAVLALGAAATDAKAQDDRHVLQWAASCAACHGTDGHSGGGMPSLAGRNADEVGRIMVEFREGKRFATVMHQHAKGYTDEEIRQIARHFSQLGNAGKTAGGAK
jgi:sulfide dehydrogenase cytochrome subunit